MKQEFNLIDEPWICVRTADCQLKEVSLKEIFLNAHEYIELSGETRTQDFAVFRLILAVMYTVFSRYDIQGNPIDLLEESIDYPVDNWEKIWKSGQIPSEPIECYFKEWHERFWLFDEEYPFYQSNAVNGNREKKYNNVKLIGSICKSENKSRLFNNKADDVKLRFSEAARWLLNINCFDDNAAKNKKRQIPKDTWVSKLSLIALKGTNLFETIMLNYCANIDINNDIFISTPSWESNGENLLDVSDSKNNYVKISVPSNQAALLSLRSRQIYLCKENHVVSGFYISGGDYFEDEEVLSEQMTLWEHSQKKEVQVRFKPKSYDASKKVWQEFGSIVILADMQKTNNAGYQFRKAGVIEWLYYLQKQKILDKNYLVKVITAAVTYDKSHKSCVKDNVSDTLLFHSELLLEAGAVWRSRILEEIAKCDETANSIYILYKNLQKANGRKDKDNKTSLSGELDAKMQFYDRIDRPFRLWLAELKPDIYDIQEYASELERKLLKITLDFGNELASQSGNNAIFGHYNKENKVSSALELNRFEFIIRKKFNLAGENNA